MAGLTVKHDSATLPRPGLRQAETTANCAGDGVLVWQGGRGELKVPEAWSYLGRLSGRSRAGIRP